MKVARDINSEFAEEINYFVQENISKHTVQLFTIDEESGFTPDGYNFKYTPIATGILAVINMNYYLFSASHVLSINSEPRTLYIGQENNFIPIIGKGSIINNPDIDVGFVELETNEVDSIKSYFEFITMKNISFNHEIVNKDIVEYFILGFPTNDTKFSDSNFITGCISIITKVAKDEHYEYYKYDKKKHYLLDYYSDSRDAITFKKVGKKKDKDLKGFSGSGLWHYSVKIQIENGIEKRTFDYNLIGIMTENQDSKYKVLVGTKIIFLLDSICLI